MSLQVHDFFLRHTERGVPVMIVDGEAIVAHVHHPDYLQTFLHAPEMRSLIERLAAMSCDSIQPEHAGTCAICQARILLATMRHEAEGVVRRPPQNEAGTGQALSTGVTLQRRAAAKVPRHRVR